MTRKIPVVSTGRIGNERTYAVEFSFQPEKRNGCVFDSRRQVQPPKNLSMLRKLRSSSNSETKVHGSFKPVRKPSGMNVETSLSAKRLVFHGLTGRTINSSAIRGRNPTLQTDKAMSGRTHWSGRLTPMQKRKAKLPGK